MRKPIIAANWKMHKTLREAENFAAQFPAEPELYEKVDVVICPPFTALQVVGEALRGTGIKLGAQNLYPRDQGAFTGEISPLMLKDLGCSYVILGHSERRQILQEDNKFINEKIKAALKHGLTPILCVGETLEERKEGQTETVCGNQLLGCLADLEKEDVSKLVIAYEPVWAIGTGVNARPEDAEKTIAFIRDFLAWQYGLEMAEQIRIQYGGSVKPDNIKELMKQKNIDGALVGGASLEVESFFSIVQGAVR